MRVRAMRAGVIVTVWQGAGTTGGELLLRNGRAAWLHAFEGPAGLWLADLQSDLAAPARLIEEAADVLDYALTDDALWWITMPYEGGRVMRMDLANDQVREVHPGPCRQLESDARRVITVCGEGLIRRASFGMIENGRAVVLDGEHVTVLPIGSADDSAGIALAGLRIEGHRVTWGEYPPIEVVPGESCHPGAGDSVLKLGEIDDDGVLGAVHNVAPLAMGCWCCNDGFWPDPDIRLTDRGLAWNYPITVPRDTRADQVVPIGWLLFDQTCSP